jgi:hypothetical protein
MDFDARRFYGAGILVLGLGNLLFGTAQLLGGPQPWYLAALEIVAGVPLTALGVLIITDSDRLDGRSLSDRRMTIIGSLALVVGLLMSAGGALLLVAA